MTLFFSANLPSTLSQTHALVIGVGKYPHLGGGAGNPAPQTFGLTQLSSPPISALAFANWLATSYRNPNTPLGTIDLLLSPDARPPAQAKAATRANIGAAFSQWYAACSQSDNNVALFYFCGHGLEAGTTVLLAEDYGADPLNPWNNAIDFNLTFNNLADFAPRTQCYLLDACRTQAVGVSGVPPLKNAAPTAFPARNAPVWKAAAFSNVALGPIGSVSYFTQALIDCLDRLAAAHLNSSRTDWVVDTASLPRALVERMSRNRDATGRAKPLACDVSGGVCNLPATTLHLIPKSAAMVMSRVSCAPDAALDYAQLLATPTPSGNGAPLNRLPKAEPWDVNLSAGVHYDIEATLPTGSPFTSATPCLQELVYPPKFECDVQVT